VVIELKRTDDGGHVELQALRYAAMVSSMTFDEVATAHSRHRALHGAADKTVDPRAEMAEFLGLGQDLGEAAISTDVRIILVSADFGREITTAVLWLNRFEGMDIRCVRLVPYEIHSTYSWTSSRSSRYPKRRTIRSGYGRRMLHVSAARTPTGETSPATT